MLVHDEEVVDLSTPQVATPDLTAAIEYDAALDAEQKADEQAADAEIFKAADAPHRFQIPAGVLGTASPEMTTQQIENVQTIQGWMYDAGLPVEIGNGIAAEADRALRAQPSMTAAESELACRECECTLANMWGKEKAAERLGLAQKFIAELDKKRPGVIDFLLDNPAVGNNPMIVQQIALHAARHYARAKR